MSITNKHKLPAILRVVPVQMSRTVRRTIGAALRDAYESLDDYGLCCALHSLYGKLDLHLYANMQHVLETACRNSGYIPYAMTGNEALNCISGGVQRTPECDRLRRIWLRHWEETGESLTYDAWQWLKSKRAEDRRLRKQGHPDMA